MPTYEYECRSCKHAFEQFQSMRDKALTKCPKCGRATLERLIGTGAAVIFKGSGFYQTDYRSESYKKSAEAESKSASGSDAKEKPVEASAPKDKGAAEKSAPSESKGDASSSKETPKSKRDKESGKRRGRS